MQRLPALSFAVVGVIFMVGISVSISLGKPWLVLLFSVASLLSIGFGFAMKAKARKRGQD